MRSIMRLLGRKYKHLFKAVFWLSVGFVTTTFLLLSQSIDQRNEESTLKLDLEELISGPFILKQDDQRLIKYIQKNFLQHPKQSDSNQPGASDDHVLGQYEQVSYVEKYLGAQRPGFFVEAGAWDGVHLSNTLYLEREKNWTGILVEPNTDAFRNLTSSGRRSNNTWAVNACLSIQDYPQKMMFEAADVYSGIVDVQSKVMEFGQMKDDQHLTEMRNSLDPSMRKVYPVQCLPLFSILLAVLPSKEKIRVDYLSLDVEGAELDILKTIPWDRVDIRVISVEIQHSNSYAIKQLLFKNGYRILKHIQLTDVLFVKEDADL